MFLYLSLIPQAQIPSQISRASSALLLFLLLGFFVFFLTRFTLFSVSLYFSCCSIFNEHMLVPFVSLWGEPFYYIRFPLLCQVLILNFFAVFFSFFSICISVVLTGIKISACRLNCDIILNFYKTGLFCSAFMI